MQKGDTVKLRDDENTRRLVRDKSLYNEFGRIVETNIQICQKTVELSKVLWTNGKLTWCLNDNLERMVERNGK